MIYWRFEDRDTCELQLLHQELNFSAAQNPIRESSMPENVAGAAMTGRG
ncbi:hypothetical protein MRBBS_0157 [Marinobacter sp. BSs20148]|nr:hypothetical protein MRBBS_0157 [Marinobacter sp. BSs20148]